MAEGALFSNGDKIPSTVGGGPAFDKASSVLNAGEEIGTIQALGIIDFDQRKLDDLFFKGNQKRREIEATTTGIGMKLGDELRRRPIPFGMSLISSGLNMTNCVKHCQHFFRRYRGIHEDVQVVAYWMMAGYLGPASSFGEAFEKGRDIRYDIKSSTKCKHEGFCILHNIGFIDLLDLDSGVNDTNHVQFRKDDTTKILELRLKRMAYLADYEPTPESLSKMLAYQHPESEQVNNLNVLLIRGCKFLLSSGLLSHYSTTNFNSLTVVEISSSPCSPMDIGIISELTLLECLNLSDLPSLEMLPDNLFHKLKHLRWLIVRGCSKLRSLPSTEVLTKLVVLDLSHCTSLHVFLDIRYPQLQMLDLSYTLTVYGFQELSTPKLTHLFLRGSNLKDILIFGQLYNLQVLDLSGCEKLVHLSPFMNVPSLKHLNLCGCASFADFHGSLFDQMSGLVELDLSGTKVKYLPSTFTCLTCLQNLSLRGLQLQTLASLPIQLLQLDLTGMGKLPDMSNNLVNLKKLILTDCQQMDVLPNWKALANLEELHLSRSSVEKLPDLSGLVNLKKLLLVDCRQLKVVPDLEACKMLKELDLSSLHIRSIEDFNLNFLKSHWRLEILNLSRSSVEKLPNLSNLSFLKKLFLADCLQLKVVPDLTSCRWLEELDLSGLQIRSMEDFNLDFLKSLWSLKILILSSSSVEKLPYVYGPKYLEKLFLADCLQLKVVPDLTSCIWLKELDLSGLQIRSIKDFNLDFLKSHWSLKILNLSRSSVEKLPPDLSNLLSLEKLLLADCLQLKVVPDLSHLGKLTTLDLSLPDDSSIDNCRIQFRSRGSFPLPLSLQKLVLTNRSGLHELFPNNHLQQLKFLDLRGTDVVNCDSILKGPSVGEIHVVYGTKSHQPPEVVDDWDKVSTHELASLISDIQNQFNSAKTSSTAFQLQLQKLNSVLRYIWENMSEPNNFSIRKRRRKVFLLELIDALKLLNRVVVKLKLIVPPRPNVHSVDQQSLHLFISRFLKLQLPTFFDFKKMCEMEAAIDGNGIKSEKHRQRPYGMLSGSCYKHGRHLFKRYANSIDWDVLIAYLMMAGCVGPTRSFWEAYWRGWDVLLAGSSSTEPQPPIQCIVENLRFFHLMDSDSRSGVKGDNVVYFQSYGEEDTTINVMSLQRMAYLVDYGPTLDSFTKMLSYQHPEANSLTTLLIRGCEFWSHSTVINYLNSLTVLEISSSPISAMDIGIISKLTRLESLNLSHLPSLETLPDHVFSKLIRLRLLILRGCSKLRSLPSIDGLTNLVVLDLSHCTSLHHPVILDIRYPHFQVLDLSYTPIVCGFRELSTPTLTHLSLRGSNLRNPLIFNKLDNLQLLDLYGCEKIVDLPPFINAPSLVDLDLSGTKVKHLPSFTCLTSLQNLSLRGLQLDLIGLTSCKRLTELDLSSSSVEELPDMCKLSWLEKLFLADCQQLKVMPDLEACKMLTELDLSGLQIRLMEDFNLDFLKSHWRLQILNLSRSSVEKLPDLSGLEKLEKLLLADCPRLNVVPDLSHLFYLTTLDLSLPNDSSIDSRHLKFGIQGQWDRGSFPLPQSLRKLVLTNRSSLQELFPNNILSELEVLDLRGTDVVDSDSILEEPVKSSIEIHVVYGTKSHQSSEVDHFDDVSRELDTLISDFQNHMTTINTDHRRLKKLLSDLRYIQKNIDGIKNNSRDSRSLLELKDAATDLSLARFAVDSAAFKLLDRLVFKLKGLVPRTRNQKDDSEAFQITKKKKSSLMRSTNKENIDIVIAKEMPGMACDLVTCYKSLSETQKKCLLCFSVFPFNEDDGKSTCALKSLVIRKKMLIYWWAGEGFIVLKNWEGRESIEEIGKQILEVLVKYNFIEPMIRKGRESTSYYCMRPFVHSFVIKRAMEENFFDIDQETCNLTPHFRCSQRACLLKPQDKFLSSCEFWARQANSPQNLASFKKVKTLFNVNNSMIDIKREWFSKMKNLKVLHLGSWGYENIELVEVKDQKFLEDLEGMKQLRLLSLQGWPTIMKLPDSVCHLTNLIILDLKECSYLEELPANIGCLTSLTHLDISNCPLLHQFPKGISLLSKLEVLKGIVINPQPASPRSSLHRNRSTLSRWWEKIKNSKEEECTFRDLLKLDRLRELSLVVKITNFPDDEDLEVFNKMKQLHKLKILWEKNIYAKDKSASSEKDESEEPEQSPNVRFAKNIEKLELWCFPHENAPTWLKPTELHNLNKLYLVGGHLTQLPAALGPDDNKWNVETLRLKHLQKLDVQWVELKEAFPKLMYLEKHKCPLLAAFPCDEDGVWKSTG